MSGFLNIGGDPNDRSYRYKMPRLVAKVEGRGNGIKTRIVNCGDIASAIHRKPAVLTKFFGCELGAQSRWEDKEETSIVNGAFEQKILEDRLMESFIPKFVLCPNCGLPETDMKVKKEIVKFDCAACGYSGNADMSHKLITFIIADDKKSKEAKKSKEKKEKKAGGGEKAAGGDEAPDKEADKEEKKEKKKDKDKSKEKSKDKDKEKKKDKDKKKKKAEESEEEEWFTDISMEAVESRRAEEMASMSTSAVAMITDEKPEAQPEGGANANEDDEGSSEQEELAAQSQELLESLVDAIGELKKAKEVLPVVEKWTAELDGAAKADLFAVIENLPENVVKHTTLILKSFYDADVVSEEDIFAWFDEADKENAAVANAAAFVDFLRE